MPDSKTAYKTPSQAAYHPRLAAVVIGLLSIVLAAGLQALGILNRLNEAISNCLSSGKDISNELPVGVIWLAAIFFAFGISFSILGVRETWRRIVLWVTATVLVMGWAPVLVLTAREPQIAAVLVAVVWSGVCALVYAGRHRTADDFSERPSDETR